MWLRGKCHRSLRRGGGGGVGVSIHKNMVNNVEDAVGNENIRLSDFGGTTVLILKEDTRRIGRHGEVLTSSRDEICTVP
jgi:hypothetical protein